MSNITKDCWIKKTEYKLFDKFKILSVTEMLDSSNFEEEREHNYIMPNCFGWSKRDE